MKRITLGALTTAVFSLGSALLSLPADVSAQVGGIGPSAGHVGISQASRSATPKPTPFPEPVIILKGGHIPGTPGDNVTITVPIILPVQSRVDAIQIKIDVDQVPEDHPDFIWLPIPISRDSEQFQALTNVLKSKNETAAAAIQNIR